jgi:hypothetical protein
MITSAIKVAYSRATATSRNLRLVMDLDQQRIWLEESEAPMLVQSKDTSGTGGAEAVTDAERAARAEGDRIVKGVVVPKPSFRKIATYGFGDDAEAKGTRALQHGIAFRAVQTAHDDFRTLTLVVSPLTGKVAFKPGPVELQLPQDDEHASDRQDNGF